MSASSATAIVSPQRDQPGEPDRIELVAGEQAEVRVGTSQDAGYAVVQQVPLVDRLDEQLVLDAPALRTRPGGGDPRRAGSRARRPLARRLTRVDERCHQTALGEEHLTQL